MIRKTGDEADEEKSCFCCELPHGKLCVREAEEPNDYEWFQTAINRSLSFNFKSSIGIVICDCQIPFEITGVCGGFNGYKWLATRTGVEPQSIKGMEGKQLVAFYHVEICDVEIKS